MIKEDVRTYCNEKQEQRGDDDIERKSERKWTSG